MCQRVVIIDKGRVAASDTPQRLVSFMKGEPQVVLEVQGLRDRIVPRVRAVPGVRTVSFSSQGDWQRLVCRCERGHDVRTALFALAASEKWVIRELRLEQSNLEDVFAEVTSEQGEGLADAVAVDAGGEDSA